MPKPSFTHEAKESAIDLLKHGVRPSTIHFSTGIPERTLRRWRKSLHLNTDTPMTEKSFPSDTHNRTESVTAPLPTPANPNDCAIPADPAADTDDQTPDTETPPGDIDPDDYADFTFIREKLMTCARAMATDLAPNDPDSNRRTLALDRVLDRIQWLDEILPDRIPEQTIRFEFYYDGEVQEDPPWKGAAERYSHLFDDRALPPIDPDPFASDM